MVVVVAYDQHYFIDAKLYISAVSWVLQSFWGLQARMFCHIKKNIYFKRVQIDGYLFLHIKFSFFSICLFNNEHWNFLSNVIKTEIWSSSFFLLNYYKRIFRIIAELHYELLIGWIFLSEFSVDDSLLFFFLLTDNNFCEIECGNINSEIQFCQSFAKYLRRKSVFFGIRWSELKFSVYCVIIEDKEVRSSRF